MAYTIAHEPSTTTGVQVAGALRPIVYVVGDLSQIAQPKYRYVLQVSIAGSVVATMAVSPNANGYGVFNVAPIIRDYLEPTHHSNGTPVHELGTTLADQTMYKSVSLNFGYRFATDAESQSETTLGQALRTLHAFRADFNAPSDKFTTTQTADYSPSSTALFMTTMHASRQVHDTDYGTCTMMTDLSSAFRANYLEVKFYQGPTLLNTGYVPWNVSWTGISKLGMVPAFPASLEETGITNAMPSNSPNWTYYTLQAKSGNLITSFDRSQIYRFYRVLDCPEPTTQLAWVNELGAWEYITMRGRMQVETSVSRENFTQAAGNTATAGPTAYEYYPWDGGPRSYRVNETEQITLHTGPLTELHNALVRSLIRSQFVLVSSYGWQAGRITESRYVEQTTRWNQYINYSVTIELAGQKLAQ